MIRSQVRKYVYDILDERLWQTNFRMFAEKRQPGVDVEVAIKEQVVSELQTNSRRWRQIPWHHRPQSVWGHING